MVTKTIYEQFSMQIKEQDTIQTGSQYEQTNSCGPRCCVSASGRDYFSRSLYAYLPRFLTGCDQGGWKSRKGDEGFYKGTRERQKDGDV